MSTASEVLSKFAAAFNYRDLSDEVVRYSKHLLLDTLGVGLGGYLSEPSRIARSFVSELGGKPESTIIGSGEKTICSNAAFLNGVMVRYLDFGDVYRGLSSCHPNENIPAALAVGERQHSTGKEVLVATILGYEIQSRFTDTIPIKGWHPTTLGGYVIPFIAGKLLGLSEKQMVNAVGISGSTNHTFYGRGQLTMMKAMGYPLATQNGINAALMAQKGLTGPRSIIEAFNHTIGHDADLTPLLKGGEKLKILESSMKPYAAAGMMQPPLTMLFPLIKQHGIRAEDVEGINLQTYEFATHAAQPESYKPETRESADHSMPYCIAIALMEGELSPDQFRGEKWKDPKVLDLMAKLKVTEDPEMTKVYPSMVPGELEIYTKKGERFKARVDYPKGDPHNPMTDTDVEAKFKMLASRMMEEDQISQIIDMVKNIEKMNDISGLMKLLAV
jgi:2-methylcitrate dehydratase